MTDTMAIQEELMADLVCMGGSDHTATMMDSFIIAANGVTTYGKYRQALRQLSTLIKGVRNLERELSRQVIQQDECAYNLLQGFRSRFDKRRCELDQDEAEWNAIDLREKLTSKRRELEHFYDAASKLRGELDFSASDPVQQLAAELDYWVEVYCRDVTLQLQCTGTVNVGLLRDVHSLPDKERDKVLGAMMQQQTVSAASRNERRTLGDGARAHS